MKKKWVIVLVVVLSIVGIAAISMAIVVSNSQEKLNQLAAMEIADVDLTAVPDGTYSGSYKVFPISVTVEVTVDRHTITTIDLVKHFNGQGASAEVIPSRVVDAQSLDVDVVSGATYSSKVILKAIESSLLPVN